MKKGLLFLITVLLLSITVGCSITKIIIRLLDEGFIDKKTSF